MPVNGTNPTTNRPLSKEALAAIPVLRSLIISEKGTSTLKRILNDYCREEGEPLPFRKFGFPSAVEYLKATDEFVLRTHMGETTIFVKPKADTAHIQKMVAAQKPAKAVQSKRNVYHWKNPQLRFSSQTGYMPKPVQPAQKHQQFGAFQKNPNNPLKRFFPTNSTLHYPKISVGNDENIPPKPAEPPKVVPTVPYAKVAAAVKVEPRDTKPVVTNGNVPPLPAMQQAFVRPMLNNNYSVKREVPFAGLPTQSALKNPYAAQNQNVVPPNPFQNDRFVPQVKNTNPFNGGNLPCPPGFNFRQPQQTAAPVKQFPPNFFNVPPPTHFQPNNIQYSSNPFRANYQPQQPHVPMAPLQNQQQSPPPPSDHIINLLDQQVRMMHESLKSWHNSQQLKQEVDMMEAIVGQYQRTISDQQLQQQAAVDRLNRQLEQLHGLFRGGRY